jgi:L-alanine-DL-glutamate epimerase-like enolase superfamily enzyme
MQKIKHITAYPVRVPVPRESVNDPEFADQMLHRDPNAKDWSNRSLWFGDVPFYAVKVEGDGGPPGWSDSSRLVNLDEFRSQARQFLGRRLDEIDARRDMIEIAGKGPHALQWMYSCKCLEIAALDWRACNEEMPLWRLFGEKVRDRVRVEYWSGFRTPVGAERVAREAVAKGFPGLKLKANLDVDVAGVTEAVFRAAGPGFHLNIDPNGRWDTVELAVPRARAMTDVSRNVLLEDPIYHDYEALAEVRRQTGIVMGLTVQWVEEVERAVRLAAADTFNIGGTFHQMIAVANAAERHGKPVWIGSGCETGLSDLTAAHIGATLPNCTIGSDLVGNLVRADDFLVTPIRFEKGHAAIPNVPGRGIATDVDAIERFRIGDPIVVE